jgi:hypothetical protein
MSIKDAAQAVMKKAGSARPADPSEARADWHAGIAAGWTAESERDSSLCGGISPGEYGVCGAEIQHCCQRANPPAGYFSG